MEIFAPPEQNDLPITGRHDAATAAFGLPDADSAVTTLAESMGCWFCDVIEIATGNVLAGGTS